MNKEKMYVLALLKNTFIISIDKVSFVSVRQADTIYMI
jgi:hypothetical protein